MTLQELETRLNYIERLMSVASSKDLPALNATYQKLLDRIVALDLTHKTVEDEPPLLPKITYGA